jgi:hypothetical protein
MIPSPINLLGDSCFFMLTLLTTLSPDTKSPIAEYHRLIYKADSIAAFHKQYEVAANVYEDAFCISSPLQHDVLNLALIYYLSGDSVSAASYIKSCYLNPKKVDIVNTAFYRGIELDLAERIKFRNLYHSSWNRTEWKRRKKLPGSKFLASLYRSDQFYRKWYIPFFLNRDNHNFKKLVKYVEQNGVPGIQSNIDTYFVREGLDYFSYILNHYLGYPKFINGFERIYPHIITALNKGDLYPYTISILTDKYLWYKYDHQIFGDLFFILDIDDLGIVTFSTRILPFCVTPEKRDSLRSNFLLRPYSHSLKLYGF